ncbi:ASCH domain-containing protein [Mycoplana ramosa]|uniref:Phage-related protein n=1 Tax=Mycoplana ramosa TaxID=40837 RepID=A0ABW3YWK7_MYCRA
MTDRPILFSAPMVRALLDGRKTQTRRALNPQPPDWATFCQQPSTLNIMHQWVPSGLWAWSEEEQTPPRALRRWPIDADGHHYWLRPKFATGDRLWVREAWRSQEHFDGQSPAEICAEFEAEYGAASCPAFYEADRKCDGHSVDLWQQSPPGRLRASMHMPRCASRLTLIVTNVRIERLQAISEEDAIAEGCTGCLGPNSDFPDEWDPSPREEYRDLWNEINGAGAWNANPWVVAYTFTVIQKNIDEVRR